ncbi:hypothetical protein [Ktedonobacter robiniae]|uniref:hypothetical protein n=1 Tax=Ktedonobacter robiniae TaxID=2778365 RepID=UPI00191529A4|nr:hypothetical protein [Ktedonobacter robiniae]
MRMTIFPYIVLEARVSLPQEQIYLRWVKNTTIFRHFLASFPDNLAKETRNLTKKRSGERQRSFF